MSRSLAQLNIARLLHPVDHPAIQDFVNGIDQINQLAENSPGFVWRLKTGSGNATAAEHPWEADPLMLVNLSVWQTPEDLKQFVYRSQHLDCYLRRADWFEKPAAPRYVLWWVPTGHTPTVFEAQEHLEHNRQHGATEYAFWFGKLFPASSDYQGRNIEDPLA